MSHAVSPPPSEAEKNSGPPPHEGATRRCSGVLMLQSTHTVIHPYLDVNAWREQMPSAHEARPAFCPRCEAPSRPVGATLGLEGHGLRTRQVRGPLAPGEPPTTIQIDVRRYRCSACEAIITVLPRGLVSRRHFSGGAIAQALARYGLDGESQGQVRRHTSPWTVLGDAARARWATLRRWIAAIGRGALFPCVRAMPAWFTARQVAERAATTLAAFAPPALAPRPLLEQAFAGAQAR